MPLELYWHPYKYYPYEFALAQREIDALLAPRAFEKIGGGIRVAAPKQESDVDRLVYFSASGPEKVPTQQARLERVNGNGPNRQSTRYSVHGLHEYKGKFNPQMPKAILNIHAIPRGSRVLDPFCGSGTSLVEAVHLGMNAFGTDINPLAVFLANTKLSSLTLAPEALRDSARAAVFEASAPYLGSDQRREYLESWFPSKVLDDIERLRSSLLATGNESKVLLACASDLLREYSLQDPIDLRIRRRKSPLPDKPFRDAFIEAVDRFALRLESAQACVVEMNYKDIDVVDPECRVTFEAENNLDFRLGTGKLRYTGCASEGDYAAISRVGEKSYELRIFRHGTVNGNALAPYAVSFIGHQGKKYGFMSNPEFERVTGIRAGSRLVARR